MTTDREQFDSLGDTVHDAYRWLALSESQRRQLREQLDIVARQRGSDRLRSHLIEAAVIAAIAVIAVSGFLYWNSLDPGSDDDRPVLAGATSTDVECVSDLPNFSRPPEVQDQLATQWAAEGYIDCTTPEPAPTVPDCVPLPDPLSGDVPAEVTQPIEGGLPYCPPEPTPTFTPAPTATPSPTPSATATLAEPSAIPAPLVQGDSTHRRLYIADGSGRVRGIDLEVNATFLKMEVGGRADIALSPDGRTLYAPGYAASGGVLTAYDAITGEQEWRVETEYTVVGYILGFGPSAVSVSPDGRFVYVYGQLPSDMLSYAIIVHDAATGEVVSSVPVPIVLDERGAVRVFCAAVPWASTSGDRLMALCSSGVTLHQYDMTTAELLATVGTPTSGATRSSVGSADGQRVYLVSSEGDLAVYDRVSLALIETVELIVDAVPAHRSLAQSGDGARLYVPIETPGNDGHYRQIRVYDTATWAEVERIDLDFDGYAGALAVDSAGDLYGVEWFSESESRVWKRDATTGATTTVSVAASEVHQLVWAAGN